jgi:apolipoprotein N-acyltransferase
MQQLARRCSLGLIFNNIADTHAGGQTRYYNSAYFLDHEGKEVARYDKIHLVPFGEYIPLRRLFFFAESVTQDVQDFSPGERAVIARLNGHPVNASVCFEAVFPDLTRRFVRDGSQLIVNLTNDAWYGRTGAPFQHLAMARWRAVENRRFFLRAANSGISAVVKPTGGLQAVTNLYREEICVGLFAFSDFQTLYTRWGDLFILICAIIMSLLVILCYRKGAGSIRPAPSTPAIDSANLNL